MSADLFSAGFAWADDPAVSHIGVADDATAAATPKTAEIRDRVGYAAPSVAPVADVANWEDIAAFERQGGEVSQPFVAPPATACATSKTTVFCASADPAATTVASVASVANWRAGVDGLSVGGSAAGIDGRDWRQLCADARLLVTAWGADLMREGWSTLEVFGLNADPRHRRLDRVGLVALIAGRTVTAVTGDFAVITYRSGSNTRFWRGLVATGGVPIWRLPRAAPASCEAVAGQGGSGVRACALTPAAEPLSTARGG